jgi:nitrogen-specific signal transduction histidine kinase/CheY-like chemotaxis protein
MKTILLVAVNPSLAETLGRELAAPRYRVVSRSAIEDAEPLLARGLVDACVVEAELRGVEDAWLLDHLAPFVARCPVVVCAAEPVPEWEAQAYLRGISHVLAKPLNPQVLRTILDRLTHSPVETAPPVTRPGPATSAQPVSPAAAPGALALLRDFSGILTHAHNADELLQQVLLLLRHVLAVNRAAIFLAPPRGDAPAEPGAEGFFRPAAAVGLTPELLARTQLSLTRGLGAHLHRTGRILRATHDEVRGDPVAQHEFDQWGATVAVPLMDRGSLLGVALLDGRLTGEPLVNSELELIFHLLEQAGLAIRHLALQAQQAANHDLLASVLRELSSACVVVDRDLRIRHANRTAVKCFGAGARATSLDFLDLPAALATKIHQVFKTGAGLLPFRFELDPSAGTSFQIVILPFQRDAQGLPASVLLTAEDQTQAEQLRRLELEASDLRMVKNMAHRLVAEIGNAVVPLAAFVQLSHSGLDRTVFAAMQPQLQNSDARLQRRVRQFRFLADDVVATNAELTLAPLLEKAFEEAKNYLGSIRSLDHTPQLVLENMKVTTPFPGNGEKLPFAVAELLCNAIQANPNNPIVTVRRVEAAEDDGGPMLAFEVHDQGPGFNAKDFENLGRHFLSTREVGGVGLGLAVARKIIEGHGGRLEVSAPGTTPHGVVRVQLPLKASVAA